MIKKICFFASIICLTGCSGLLTSKQNVDQFYTVNALTEYPDTYQVVDATIMIQRPSVSKGLDSNKITLMYSPQQLDYYAHARWSSNVGNMVQTSLIESFENSEVLARVGGDQSALKPNYLLMLEVHDFQAEYQQPKTAPIVHVKLVAKLVDFPDRNLRAVMTTETYQQAEENELPEIVRAFDQAFIGAQALLIEETLDYFAQ